DLLPEEANAPWAAEAEACVVVLLAIGGRTDRRGERADGAAFGPCEPLGLVLGRGDGDEKAELRPAADAVDERRPEPREALEACAHGREALERGCGEAEALAGVVAEPREAELVVAATAQEGVREPAEDRPAARLLRGEAAEPAVEDEGGVVGAEAA